MIHLEESQAAEGEHLTVQGESCHSIYFITAGRATLQLDLRMGKRYAGEQLGPDRSLALKACCTLMFITMPNR